MRVSQDHKPYRMSVFRFSKATRDKFWFLLLQTLAEIAEQLLQPHSTVTTQRQHLQKRATHGLSCAEAPVRLQINKVHERLQAVSGHRNILAPVRRGALPPLKDLGSANSGETLNQTSVRVTSPLYSIEAGCACRCAQFSPEPKISYL